MLCHVSKDEQSDDDKIRKSVSKEQVKASKDKLQLKAARHGKPDECSVGVM